ncbi:MAG: VWA domain-containing protein, partial [Deltaproteobacteria bacterium]|nr:VWA domain-containing protein [Deltaproteobacteria bacterium]
MNNLLTSYSIDFNPPVNTFISSIITLFVIILTVYSIFNLLPDLKKKTRIYLSALRISAVIIFLFIFFQPSVIETTYLLEKDTVALLIDASRSMTYKSGTVTRFELAKEIAAELLKRNDLRSEHNLVIYYFSKNIYLTGSLQDIRLINEDSTDILTSLENIKARHPDLSNIILLSDGIDNNILRSTGENTSSVIKNFSKNFNIPIHTFLTGGEKEVNDISIRLLSFSPVGFSGKGFDIAVRISNNSDITDYIPLNVKENDTPIYSGKFKVPRYQSKDVNLTIFPKNTGRNIYEISVPPLSGEEYTENNSEIFTSKIKKENLRILQITGSVSYDVRFLRHLFKKAPDVDLISFFILRTLESDVNAPDSELSLIPFPTDTVIKESIFSFDAVIFQDFGFVPYGLNSTFSELNNFIKKG